MNRFLLILRTHDVDWPVSLHPTAAAARAAAKDLDPHAVASWYWARPAWGDSGRREAPVPVCCAILRFTSDGVCHRWETCREDLEGVELNVIEPAPAAALMSGSYEFVLMLRQSCDDVPVGVYPSLQAARAAAQTLDTSAALEHPRAMGYAGSSPGGTGNGGRLVLVVFRGGRPWGVLELRDVPNTESAVAD
jgi:hypothetical protein